jgi:hypothetical protein
MGALRAVQVDTVNGKYLIGFQIIILSLNLTANFKEVILSNGKCLGEGMGSGIFFVTVFPYLFTAMISEPRTD